MYERPGIEIVSLVYDAHSTQDRTGITDPNKKPKKEHKKRIEQTRILSEEILFISHC